MYTVGIEIIPDRSLKQRSSFVLIKIIIKSIKSVAQRVSKTRKRPRKKFVSKKEDIKLQLRESKSQRPGHKPSHKQLLHGNTIEKRDLRPCISLQKPLFMGLRYTRVAS